MMKKGIIFLFKAILGLDTKIIYIQISFLDQKSFVH